MSTNNLASRICNRAKDVLRRKFYNLKGGTRPRVVMLHHGRSGSTVLAKMLSQHSDVQWDDEYFHLLSERLIPNVETHKKWSDPLKGLQRRVDSCRGSVYGFETKFKHIWEPHVLKLSTEEFFQAMDQIGIDHWIVLKRSNYLRMMLSLMRGMATESWHASKGDRNEAGNITVDLENASIGLGVSRPVLEQFQCVDESFEEIAGFFENRKVMHLEYEGDIFEDPRKAYGKICEFLNMKTLAIEPTLQKSAFKPIRDLVSNYEEISSLLQNTKYAWMLDA